MCLSMCRVGCRLSFISHQKKRKFSEIYLNLTNLKNIEQFNLVPVVWFQIKNASLNWEAFFHGCIGYNYVRFRQGSLWPKKYIQKKKSKKKIISSFHLYHLLSFCHNCLLCFILQLSVVLWFSSVWIQCSSPWLVVVYVLLSVCWFMWYKYWFYPGKWCSCLIKYHCVYLHGTSTGSSQESYYFFQI